MAVFEAMQVQERGDCSVPLVAQTD